jgi:hypothetical protein
MQKLTWLLVNYCTMWQAGARGIHRTKEFVMPSKSGTKYMCPHCSEQVTVFINLSENPTHKCAHMNKVLPLYTAKEIENISE